MKIVSIYNDFCNVLTEKINNFGLNLLSISTTFDYDTVKRVFDKVGGDLDKTSYVLKMCIEFNISPDSIFGLTIKGHKP